MSRTNLLQEIRKMRFEEAYGGGKQAAWDRRRRSGCPGVCERTFRHYVDRYEDEGL